MPNPNIFPKVTLFPRLEALGARLVGLASFNGTQTLATHGDHLPSWLPEADPRPAANEIVN